jgi:hypothetical protein
MQKAEVILEVLDQKTTEIPCCWLEAAAFLRPSLYF